MPPPPQRTRRFRYFFEGFAQGRRPLPRQRRWRRIPKPHGADFHALVAVGTIARTTSSVAPPVTRRLVLPVPYHFVPVPYLGDYSDLLVLARPRVCVCWCASTGRSGRRWAAAPGGDDGGRGVVRAGRGCGRPRGGRHGARGDAGSGLGEAAARALLLVC